MNQLIDKIELEGFVCKSAIAVSQMSSHENDLKIFMSFLKLECFSHQFDTDYLKHLFLMQRK